MAEWVNVFERAVLDMKAEGLNDELKSMGWHLFNKSNLTLQRQERVLGAAEGEYEFAAIRGALIKLFPDTIICQEKRSVPDWNRVMCRTENQMMDSRTDFANLVTGSQGVRTTTFQFHVVVVGARVHLRLSSRSSVLQFRVVEFPEVFKIYAQARIQQRLLEQILLKGYAQDRIQQRLLEVRCIGLPRKLLTFQFLVVILAVFFQRKQENKGC